MALVSWPTSAMSFSICSFLRASFSLMAAASASESFCRSISSFTYSRYPMGEGTRPALVWGCSR